MSQTNTPPTKTDPYTQHAAGPVHIIVDGAEPRVNHKDMHKYETETMSRILLNAIDRAFSDPAFAAEYEAWLATRPKASKPSKRTRKAPHVTT